MKILVFAHQLVTGGTAVNAIELAATLRDQRGHDVVMFASPGRMSKLIDDRRLRYVAAPDARFHPTMEIMRALRDLVRVERPALIHAWDWWQCIDAYYSVHLPMGIPMVVSDMTMNVTRMLPKRLPTTWGTPELVDRARALNRRPVGLLVPPVDIDLNAPGASAGSAFRAQFGFADSDIVLVTVSRLANWLKGESLRRTIDAVQAVGKDVPVHFIMAGDGEARADLEQRAAGVNAQLGRRAIVFAGNLIDPRPAYAAADIVVGMGSSALRGMAFGKPVVVVGENGFSAALRPETADAIYYRGMYGIGDGDPGNATLIATLRDLVERRRHLVELGQFAREFVVRRFSLTRVTESLDDFFGEALATQPSRFETAMDSVRTASIYLREQRFATPSRPADPNS